MRLSNVESPLLDQEAKEKLEKTPIVDIMSELVPKKNLRNISHSEKLIDDRTKRVIPPTGNVFNTAIEYDPRTDVVKSNKEEYGERFLTVQSDQGVLVVSEEPGTALVQKQDTAAWSFQNTEIFKDIDSFVRGEFDLSDRTHVFRGDGVFRVPSYSALIDERGNLDRSVKRFISKQEFEPVFQDSKTGSGLWAGQDKGFKASILENEVVLDSFQEFEYSPDLGRLQHQNSSVGLTDRDRYQDIDFNLLANQVLQMASETDRGLSWNNSGKQNLLGFKKNSSDSELEILGLGDQALFFSAEAGKTIEDRLVTGNDVSDLKARLGEMVERPIRDDRFQGEELGYWEAGKDFRIYTYTPRLAQKTFVVKAGSHSEVRPFYDQRNTSAIAKKVIQSVDDIDIVDEYKESGIEDGHIHISDPTGDLGRIKGYNEDLDAYKQLESILESSGHSIDDIEKVTEFLRENIGGNPDVRPERSEYFKMLENQGYELEIPKYYDSNGYNRIDLVIETSIEDLSGFSQSDLLDSLDTDSTYNEVHLDDSLSVNLRFEGSDREGLL